MIRVAVLSLIVVCLATIGMGADVVVQYNGRTGDASLDVRLRDFDVVARANLPQFDVDINQAYGIPRAEIDRLRQRNMAPADIYMTARVAKVAKRPVEDVAKEFEKSQGKGWGVIAKSMGIKPGSKEFHELKADDAGLLEKSAGKGPKEDEASKGEGKDHDQMTTGDTTSQVDDQGGGESQKEGKTSKTQGKGKSQSKGKGHSNK